MMDGKAVMSSFEDKKLDTLYPMLFGVSCGLFALRLLPEPETRGDPKRLETRNRMLRGSAHVLGLLIWRIKKDSQIGQELKNAHQLIDELKRRRSEEAKANEKVVSIFAAREQTWFAERKRLRQQINALRILETKREASVSELHEKLKEKDRVVQEEEWKRRDIEEKVKKAEDIADQLRETVNKHKTVFIELVSNQRQLEAEMGRALRQVRAANNEIDSTLEQKEQSVVMAQRLSMELARTREDLQHKDQVLSAMLRKSRLDTAEKEMMLKEMKLDKVMREQAELETARWKAISESRQCHIRQESIESADAGNAESSSSNGLSKSSSSTWKMDVHALGVSYKIKRLTQQLSMLEKLKAGKQDTCENSEDSNRCLGLKGFNYGLVSLLNKQIDRYQSLQGKTDDLCQRIHDGNLNLSEKVFANPRTADETKRLQQFLEETFQIQRYIVATGQKLTEVQAQITSGFVCDLGKIEKPDNFDIKRFGDGVRTLFQEVQRGLEVRLCRIIGDLEGTLACNGIIHLKK